MTAPTQVGASDPAPTGTATGSAQLVRCFFGHHKGATTWIRDITDDIAARADLRTDYVHKAADPGDLAALVEANATQLLRYVNADIDEVRTLRTRVPLRGVHVVRDPRDTVVSAYFSHRDSHPAGPWLDEHRTRLRSLDLHDGLRAELTFRATTRVMDEIRRWDYDQPDVLELRMEQLIERPLETMEEAFSFLRLDELLDMPELLRIVDEHRFETKTGGRRRGDEDQANHYRKGIAGDWRNYFQPEHVALFKELYGDLVVDLGYEPDHGWG